MIKLIPLALILISVNIKNLLKFHSTNLLQDNSFFFVRFLCFEVLFYISLCSEQTHPSSLMLKIYIYASNS